MKLVNATVIGTVLFFSAQANATVHVITIEDGGFTPDTLEIMVNDDVRWEIGSGEVQSATTTSGTPGSPDSLWGATVGFSTPYTRTFTEVGTFSYFDSINGFTGQITSSITADVFDDGDDAGTLLPVTLSQNNPNPFNAATQIQYNLDIPKSVQLGVYNILGQRVRVLEAGPQAAGSHTVTWDGRDQQGNSAPSGIYFTRLIAGNSSMIRKMVLLR